MRPLVLPLMLPATLCLLVPLGCGGGGAKQANVDLRRQNQELRTQVAQQQQELAQLRSDIRRLEGDAETLPTLPQERLEEMWTVSGLKFGRLTGIDRAAEGQPLKVYLKPVDTTGDTLKAAGEITIEAFNLDAENTRLGSWTFPLSESKPHWISGLALNEYVLTCPWEGEPPAEGTGLLVRARFVDALTQRSFEATKNLR